MPPNRSKYKRTTDLYTDGREVVLDDGGVIFLRALNPLERQEAMGDAAAARARIVLALEEIDSDEQVKVRGAFYTDGREVTINFILTGKTGEMISRVASEVREEKEWKEKLEVFDRSAEIKARPMEDIEHQLLLKIETDFLAEVNRRYDNERENQKMQYELMSDGVIIDELLEQWRDKRGQDVADNEFRVTELWYAARACDGVHNDADNTWDHGACEGHKLQVFATKDEVAKLPDRLMQLLLEEGAMLNMSVREAKNSARLQSFSDSSLQPSVPEESTPYIPTETPLIAPGISTQPSSTG